MDESPPGKIIFPWRGNNKKAIQQNCMAFFFYTSLHKAGG